MATLNLEGLGIALVTPFTQKNSLDYPALEKLINRVIAGGADYLVVLGTTAETPTLSKTEKKEIIYFIKKIVAGKIPLVLGMGGNNTMGVVNDILEADLEGYSAILSVVPYYNKPTQEGIYKHFTLIAEASPLPLILYNVPGRTGINMTAETILSLAYNNKKIIGVKEASGNLSQCREIASKAPSGFYLISGNDGDTAEIMKMGGKGVISVLGNALPEEMKKIILYSVNKEFNKAHDYQEKLMPKIRHIFEDGSPAGVKSVLAKLGIINNVLRLPLLPVSRYVEEKLEQDFSEYFV